MSLAVRKKRYNSINEALKRRFGCKVFKVSLTSGLGCPNRNGTIGMGGCAFCSEESYLTAVDVKQWEDCEKAVRDVLKEGIEYIKRRHGASKFISYFQSGTNTCASAERLKKIFEQAIDHPDVVGLAIGTRPDCIAEEHCALFENLSTKTMLWVELGLQSANDKTLEMINRGHTAADFSKAVKLLKTRDVSVVAHVILGLPGESMKDMMRTADFLNREGVDGVKIHNLHVLKGTRLEEWYEQGKIEIPALETYAQWVASFLERLKPSIFIHRVNGHAPKNITVAPQWSINKLAIFNAVERELERRNSYQGKTYSLNV
jgi:radical SAM protein (TIGR01212 family)